MKNLSLLLIASLFICSAQGQVRTPTLYVTGTVLSEEKMLVSVLGTKTIEGNVVSAEINGKRTEAKTDNQGHAILDFSAIAGGLVAQGIAIIKTFDKNGNLIGTANTTVQQGVPALARPVIEPLPKNLPNGEAVTIPGQNLGADAKLACGDKVQKTLSASDKEMIVSTNAKTGEQPVYVTTPNGVSERQTVNVYNLDFSLPKNSVKPRENVQATVHYESIPVGTKLIFTNKSPETIKMTIPGAQNAANECVYTVPDKNGSLPVNITGIIRGNFTIALDMDFKNQQRDSIPKVFYDEKPRAPGQPPAAGKAPAPPIPPALAAALKIKEAIIEGLRHFSKHLTGGIREANGEKFEIAGVIPLLKASIKNEVDIYNAEQAIIDDKTFRNLVNTDRSGNMKKALENIKNAMVEEKKAMDEKKAALKELNGILNSIPPLIENMTRAIANEKNGLNRTAAGQENAVLVKLKAISGSLDLVSKAIDNATDANKNAMNLKRAAINDLVTYLGSEFASETQKKDAENIQKALQSTLENLAIEKDALIGIFGEIGNLKNLNNENIEQLDKLITPEK